MFLEKKDIAAMKLNAIETNGTRAKDFIDIYYLLKEMDMESMFSYYKTRYNTNNIFNVKRSMVYFDNVEKKAGKMYG